MDNIFRALNVTTMNQYSVFLSYKYLRLLICTFNSLDLAQDNLFLHSTLTNFRAVVILIVY